MPTTADGFRLSEVCPDLIQKIMPKLDSIESYCRMRRTCKYIDEIAQNSCHMIVRGRWYLKIIYKIPDKKEQDPQFQIQLDQRAALDTTHTYRSFWGLVQLCCFGKYTTKVVDLRSFHRFTLSILEFDRDTDHGPSFCEFLRDHRITCQNLIISCESNLTMPDCSELIKILRPTEIDIDSTLSKRCDAVLYSEGVKSVIIRMEIESAFLFAKQLFPLFENVTLHVKGARNDDWWYGEMSATLNDLQFYPVRVLRTFTFVYYQASEPRTSLTQEIMTKFSAFNIERVGDTGRWFEISLNGGITVVNIRY